jgi:riboflavin synthase
MFTGIIEELGTVEGLEARAAGGRLRVRGRVVTEDLERGDSVAVNGVCLTTLDVGVASFSADISPETLSRTNLGDLRIGSLVNLERPLTPSGRLDGHIVQGHIDGTGEFVSLEPLGDDNWWLKVRIPPELDRYVVFKGSIAIDGVSLTVASLEGGVLGATIIPYTYENTVFRAYRPGARVNLECDILAKYLEKMLESVKAPQSRLTEEKLREMGY